jgi:CRISPR-associated protein Cpf1
LKYSSAEQAKREITKFSNIVWNNAEKRFDFTYDIKNFSTQKEYPKNTTWTVCSSVERYRWNKDSNNNKGGYDYYKNLTPEFEKLFSDFQIDITKNILEQI